MDLTCDQVLNYIEVAPIIIADCEWDDKKDIRVPGSDATLGVSLSTVVPGTQIDLSQYYPVRHFTDNINPDTYERLKTIIENAKCIVFHNAKGDLVALQDLGIEYTGKFYDTMLMEHYVNGKQLSHRLEDLSRKYGGDPKDMPPVMKHIIKTLGWKYVPSVQMTSYARKDVEITRPVFDALYSRFQKFEDLGLWDIEQEFIRTLIKIERFGIRINKKICQDELDRGTKRMAEIREELGGLNPNSNPDLKKLLIDQMGLPVLKESEKTGKPSFDKKVMEKYEAYLSSINNPTASLILEYRGWMKTTSSNYAPYLSLVSPDGRLRPNFETITTVTTRLSCRNPNLQQIPRISEKDWNGQLKKAFIPATGYKLWECDYSQLEFRLIASYAGEQELIDAFNDPTRDVFTEMAERLGWKRQDVKTFVYMVSYGAGIAKIMVTFGVREEVAREMRDTFFEAYSKLSSFDRSNPGLMQRCMQAFKSKGFIKLWTGREIRNKLVDKPYAALDYLAQGGGAEIVKRKLVELGKFIDWKDCRMVLQVHDAIVFEIRDGEEDKWLPSIREIMQDVDKRFGVRFPIECKVWGTDDKYEFAA